MLCLKNLILLQPVEGNSSGWDIPEEFYIEIKDTINNNTLGKLF